jgi:choline dehydrogenase-like flavoprotein
MGSDTASSVVDANLRAHDVPNLYLVGGGAFVTVSSSPPTLTIAALAIRTAGHIAEVPRPSDGPSRPWPECRGRPRYVMAGLPSAHIPATLWDRR